MRVFEPTQITVLTTSKCTAACRHCCMHSSPDRDDMLTYEQMQSILDQAFDTLKLQLVIFAGGEPMLLGEDLYKAITLCKRRGAITRMVSNGYWAKALPVARRKVAELRAAGLDELNISTDDYHLPWIKLETARNAFRAGIEGGFASVAIANAYGPKSEITPEVIEREFGRDLEVDLQIRYDSEGSANTYRRKQGSTLTVLSNAHVQRLGAGIEGVAPDEVIPCENLDAIAEEVGGCPWAVRSAAISAKGHFVSCCGFEVEHNPILDYGDLNTRPLTELLDKADDDLLTNMIAIYGPIRLMRILQEMCPDEVVFPRNYSAYCEVCQDLVGIEKNRAALYKYMGAFAGSVLEVRRLLIEKFQVGDRVALPQVITGVPRKRSEEESAKSPDSPPKKHLPVIA